MSSKKPTQPIGSSVDVGWSDGKPRDVTDETKEFLEASGGGRVGASQISGRQPRPRSKNLPKPSLTVNYQDVARNATEGADLGQASLEELLLQNAEAVKQFEYLEKSLVSFRDTVGSQASQLRQPASIVRQSIAMVDLHDVGDKEDALDVNNIKKSSKKKGLGQETEVLALQGAPPVFPDGLIGRTDAMNALGNIYAEGDPEFEDRHLQPLDPIIVEGEGYMYGIRSVQIVALKESVRGNDFIAVYSGPNHAAGITAAGQVYTWGANDMRQLGYPGAEEGILGIDMDPRPVTSVAGHVASHVGCGKHHTMLLTEEGQIYAWGAFGNGQLGLGELSKEKFPHGYVDPMRLHGFDTRAPRTVACGFYHTVIVDGLGDLWSCGSGDSGAHGHDNAFDIASPQLLQPVSSLDFRQVACGAAHTIALTASGQLWCWGLNQNGQLGLGDMINRKTPTMMDMVQGKNVRKISCGEAHSAFLSDREIYTFGDGSHGALGHGNSKSQLLPKVVVKMGEDARLRDIDCGPQFTLCISDLGQLYYWGNMKSTSGRGSKHVFNMPRRFKGLEAIYGVGAGEHEISALVRIPVAPPLEHKFKAGIFVEEAENGIIDGYIGRACTWGKAAYGKLGHGAGKLTQSNLKTPFAIYGTLYHYSVTVVACGQDHSCCIADNGTIFTWGSNKDGQLGLRDFKPRVQPTMIDKCCDPDVPRLKNTKNKIFRDVIVGNWHCLAITTKKKVYAWGKNKYGQLGLGHTNSMHTPTSILPLSDPLNPKNVRCIATGKSHSAVVTEDGDVHTWGRGWDGQLGHDVVTEIELEPRIVPAMENKASAAVACGRAHTVVVTDNGNVWSWGDNKAGQLGVGTLNSSPSPHIVSSLDEQEVTQVACGDEHTIVITIANEVYGFGSGVHDQLGVGTLGIFPKPQRIPGLTAVPRIQAVTCGSISTAVIGGDDTVYLLGRWDGLTSFVPSKLSKFATVRKSMKGTTPDVLETPLGIEEIKAIALGVDHGMIIGLEEDRQNIIQKRKAEERALSAAAQATERVAVRQSAQQKSKPRTLVQPFVSYQHGGDPFPDELHNPELQSRVVPSGFDGPNSEFGLQAEYDFDEHEDGDESRDDSTSMRSGMTGKSGISGVTGVTGSGIHTVMEARSVAATEMQNINIGYKGYIVAWGNNQYHQLGLTGSQMSIGHRNKQKKGQEFVPMKVPGDKIAVPPTLMVHPITCPIELPSVSIVACGEYHTLAVCQDGTLWSWGRNQCGQLGHGDKKENKYKTPTQIIALAKKICIKAAAGGQHSMVLTDANKIYSWGLNNFGQLGIGNMDDHDLPRPDIIPSLRRSGACHITCGYSHSVALLKNEQLYVWGRNDCGQLGLGHYTHSPIPEHVTALKKYQVQQVCCGYDHVIAFVAEDKGPDTPPVERVYTWGRGEEGQLGHNDTYSRCVPKVVATLEARGVRAVMAGGFCSAAIDEAKQVYTWGDSREGQLGHGDHTSLSVPAILKKPIRDDDEIQDVHGTFRARSIVIGPSYMMAMGLDEEVEKYVDPTNDSEQLNKYSWGCNRHGQLGMPFHNSKKQTEKIKTNEPDRIPFMQKVSVREIACGLEHVVAVVDVATGRKPADARKKIDELRVELAYLANGDFEEDVYPDEHKAGRKALEHMRDEEMGGDMMVIEQEEENFDLEYEDGLTDDEDEHEKLHYPKQIYDRVHDVSPLIIRLGLDEYAPIFEDQQINFDSFLTLEVDDLIDIGVDSFGARRRIMRAVHELRHAQRAPEPPEDEDEEDDFDPPGYDRDEQEGHVPLKPGYHTHPADWVQEGLQENAAAILGDIGKGIAGLGGGMTGIGAQGIQGMQNMVGVSVPNFQSPPQPGGGGYNHGSDGGPAFQSQQPQQRKQQQPNLFGMSLPFMGNQNGRPQHDMHTH